MAEDKDYDEIGGNVDDFYKKKTTHPEDYEGKDIEDDYQKEDTGTDYEDLEDKWYGIENEYRSHYPDLTDEDVNVEPNRFRKTLVRIGRRRGKTLQEILNEIENW